MSNAHGQNFQNEKTIWEKICLIINLLYRRKRFPEKRAYRRNYSENQRESEGV